MSSGQQPLFSKKNTANDTKYYSFSSLTESVAIWTPADQKCINLTAVLVAANPWDVIANLQTSFVGTHTGLGLGNTIQLDAVEVEICVTGLNKITLFGFEI